MGILTPLQAQLIAVVDQRAARPGELQRLRKLPRLATSARPRKGGSRVRTCGVFYTLFSSKRGEEGAILTEWQVKGLWHEASQASASRPCHAPLTHTPSTKSKQNSSSNWTRHDWRAHAPEQLTVTGSSHITPHTHVAARGRTWPQP